MTVPALNLAYFSNFIGFQASFSRAGCWWSFPTSVLVPATNAVETAHYFKLRQAEHLQVFDVHHVLRKGSAFSSRFQQGKRHVYTSLTSWILTLPWNHVGTHFNSTTNLLLCVQSKIWLPMTDLHFAWNPCTSKCLLNVPNHPGKVLRLQLINITSDQTCLKVINIIL